VVAIDTNDTGLTVAGGKGANQAVSCSRLGFPVSFVCQFGNDSNSAMLENVMNCNNVDISLCLRSTKPSGLGLVFLHNNGAVSCVVVGGSNSAWPESMKVENFINKSCDVACVLLQMEIPQKINELIAAAAYKLNIPVFQDIGGAEREISKSHYRHCTYISPNLSELRRLSNMPVENENEILAAVKKLQKSGARNVLVTLGDQGSLLVTEKNEIIKQPCCPVDKVVDETGAGDNYRAAFAVSHFLEKKSLSDSMAFASAAGAVSVSKMGAIPSCATRDECLASLSKLRGGSSSNEDDEKKPFPFKFASRLNSMKARKELWSGSDDVFGWIKRQGLIRGLDLVDFNYPQHLTAPASCSELRDSICSALKEAKLSCGAVCLRYPAEMQLGALTHPDRALRGKAIALTKEACEWATALGAHEVVVWSAFDGYDYSLQVDHLALWDDIVTAFQEVCDLFPQIRLSLEYKPTDENTRFFAVPSTGAALLLQQAVNRPNFGLTLDFGHCLMAGENPAQSVAMVSRMGRLFGVQLGDGYGRLGAEDGLAFGSVHPLAALEFVLWLVKTDFKGHIYFDTFPRNEDPVRECEYNIRQFKRMYRIAEKLLNSGEYADVLQRSWQQHDALELLELLEKLNFPQ